MAMATKRKTVERVMHPITIELPDTPRGEALHALKVLDEAKWREIVADHLKRYGSTVAAAKVLEIGTTPMQDWHKNDPELSKIKVAGRGRAPVAKGISKEDIDDLIKQAGGLERAAEACALTPQRLDKFRARGQVPARVFEILKQAAGWSKP